MFSVPGSGWIKTQPKPSCTHILPEWHFHPPPPLPPRASSQYSALFVETYLARIKIVSEGSKPTAAQTSRSGCGVRSLKDIYSSQHQGVDAQARGRKRKKKKMTQVRFISAVIAGCWTSMISFLFFFGQLIYCHIPHLYQPGSHDADQCFTKLRAIVGRWLKVVSNKLAVLILMHWVR